MAPWLLIVPSRELKYGHHFSPQPRGNPRRFLAKIVGIFTRLAKRDGKARYLAMIPRVWQAMERDLAHEALAPVAAWFDANIPQEIRDTAGGEIQ